MPVGRGSRDAPTPTPAATILVVDDDAAKHLAIKAILEPLGPTVIAVESGEAALRAVMTQTFAAILMDVQMPNMDGYETARFIRMRKESEYTPIIFITAHAKDEAQIPLAYANGAADFIFAPLDAGILRAKVSVFVGLFLKSQDLEQSLSDVTMLSEAHTRTVLEYVADGIVTVSDDGVIESFNRAASHLFGYREQDAIGQSFSIMLAPEYRGFDSHEGARQHILLQQQRTGRAAELMGCRRDGSTFPMELDLSDVRVGARHLHIGCIRDISERQSSKERLRYQALHDALTDLPNRVLFGDRVNQAIRAAARAHEPLALLVMDLDDFKQVNDTLGHQYGDALLKLVADRLVGCLRDADTVARLGGDEFGILPSGLVDLAGAVAVAWKIEQALEAPFLVKGHSIDVRSSIGIALHPEHGDTIDDLLRRADLAMYDAKLGGDGHAVFIAEQEETPARRLALLGDLRHCIEREQLVLHYQPKIDLATLKTVGVEALIRWNHPSGRLMMPDEFMPEVEHNELMIPMTRWVVAEALRRLGSWRDQGYDLTMAVNLGARCLAPGTGIFELVEELMRAWDIPPSRLTFELTESALIDTDGPGLVQRLQGMGERLSIDDFGTGYSSLVYLQRLPVVEIKADKSFVMTMSSVKDDAVIVRSIIDLARNLSLKVVAEGVEDEATTKLLIAYGCDEAQGYHFSRPIAGDDVVEWLETSAYAMPRALPPVASPLDQLDPVAVRVAHEADA